MYELIAVNALAQFLTVTEPIKGSQARKDESHRKQEKRKKINKYSCIRVGTCNRAKGIALAHDDERSQFLYGSYNIRIRIGCK